MTTRRDALKLLAASAGSVPMLAGTSERASAQSRESTARIVWPYDVSSLDPVGVGVQRSTWGVSIHIYDRLVTYDATESADGTRRYNPGKIEPELAERWEVSADGKTLDFHLRKDAVFHDGAPVTAEDVRWSIARALSVPAAAGVMRIGGISNPENLEAVNPHLFRVKLAEPNRYSLLAFTIPFAAVMNKALALRGATAQDPLANEWLRRNSAGGGAFKIESFRSDQVLLTRHDGWKSGKLPTFQQVAFQTVPEASTRIALVERRSADVAIELPPADFEAVAGRGVAKAVAIPMANHMDFLAFNSQAAPFDDVRIRQAIALAVPHDQIFKSVYRSRGMPLHGGKADPTGGVFPQAHAFPHDVEKTRALLAAAGKSSGFETTLAYSQGKAAYFDPLALAVRDALGKVGIKVNIERLAGAQFDEKLAARALPMVLENRIAWLSQPDYWFKVFYTGTAISNVGNYKSDKLVEMLNALPATAGPDEYRTRTAEMAKLVLTEVPMLPIRQGAFELALAVDVTGYTYWFHGLPDARSLRRLTR